MRTILAVVLCLCASLANAEPAAWRAHRPTQPGELLLLGSIHVLRAEDHPLPGRIDQLFAETDRVVFELDLDDVAALQSELASAAALPSGQSLRALLGPELHASARAQATLYGLELDLLDGYQPWFVAVSLTTLGMQALGYRSLHGIEHHVRSRALAAGKEILGLESVDDQVRVFSGLSMQQQAALVAQAVAELNRTEWTMTELVAAWKSGQLQELRTGLVAEFDAFPGLYARLIAERNVAWVAQLEALVRDDARSLIVVGALHLVGNESLVELLRERGFEIQEIR